jgi:hypothetical protein
MELTLDSAICKFSSKSVQILKVISNNLFMLISKVAFKMNESNEHTILLCIMSAICKVLSKLNHDARKIFIYAFK